MKKFVLSIAILSASIFVLPAFAEHGEAHKEELKIANPEQHNAKLLECMRTALDRHPGAVLEIEAEVEDGKTIIDVDIQGKDGKTWEVECDAATGDVLEDKEESDDNEEKEEQKK